MKNVATGFKLLAVAALCLNMTELVAMETAKNVLTAPVRVAGAVLGKGRVMTQAGYDFIAAQVNKVCPGLTKRQAAVVTVEMLAAPKLYELATVCASAVMADPLTSVQVCGTQAGVFAGQLLQIAPDAFNALVANVPVLPIAEIAGAVAAVYLAEALVNLACKHAIVLKKCIVLPRVETLANTPLAADSSQGGKSEEKKD